MKMFISHGADPDDWFIVEPREGHTSQSIVGTEITPEMAIASLLAAGRTVYALDAVPMKGGVFGLEEPKDGSGAWQRVWDAKIRALGQR